MLVAEHTEEFYKGEIVRTFKRIQGSLKGENRYNYDLLDEFTSLELDFHRIELRINVYKESLDIYNRAKLLLSKM
ncbi:hypothetical protein [Bacillus anthracis]|uniref:hypothetical protein n=1 Tax=Bacillus anthracis TaxID=1392 RepID=UPI002DB8B25B|nr:hypothetical protein [Bacillus anthracis]MEB9454151.1 hypothetical protein [Bacillus anthracis]